MSNTIGVRQLKNQASRIIRAVREEMAEFVVTLRGEPVAILRPLTEDETHRIRLSKVEECLAEMKALAREVTADWVSDRSGVELVEEQRR
jgi:prevent-host-death family protein